MMAVALLLVLAGGELLVSRGRGLDTYAYTVIRPTACTGRCSAVLVHYSYQSRHRLITPLRVGDQRRRALPPYMELVQCVAVLCRTPATSMPYHKKRKYVQLTPFLVGNFPESRNPGIPRESQVPRWDSQERYTSDLMGQCTLLVYFTHFPCSIQKKRA